LISAKPESGEPRIAATVAGGAPCDFANIPPDSQLLSMVMGGTPREKPKLYHDVAPINFANASCPATFFYHGTKDAIVPPKSSRDMEQKLRGCGVVTTYYDVSDQGHLSTFIDPVAKQKAIKFLNQHLKSDH
jgi:dipeptidyl aminopeptidase/acylaminoacyl peptidase